MKVLHGQLSQTAALMVLGFLLLLSSIMSLVIGHRGGVYSRKSQSISTGMWRPTILPPSENPRHCSNTREHHTFSNTSRQCCRRMGCNFSARRWFYPVRSGGSFGVALFHQMHCLTRIREAMALRTSTPHVHHCFTYLRQVILCEANPTIEPVIPIIGRRSVNAEVPRVCKDWTKRSKLSSPPVLKLADHRIH
ncbi:hypothetical protein B0H13DRAFT_2092852 [Mycena leptocephala]|nr:hypothetical protein B0H13DRAFT_2092852 [Mycena leptocephala]